MDVQLSDMKVALDAKGIHVHRPDFILLLPQPKMEETLLPSHFAAFRDFGRLT
jgi:hypothetical protein